MKLYVIEPGTGEKIYLQQVAKDRNHLMEMLRTCLALCTLVLQVIILLKLFEII